MNTADLAPVEEARASVTAPRAEIVVVAHEPGPWFEETLASIAAQDYPRVGVTVLLGGADEGLEEEITAAVPGVGVRRIDPGFGYGRSANEMLDDESPPAFYLFCHDDVALAADALRLLVEEAIRSNASVAGPKLVDWDRPDELLEVGLDVDKLGHAASRVEVGERDQEQHDAVTDVFAIPGAAQLVRADLFHALGGYDGTMGVTGEDIDFCWRAHVAGARVMVVPSAVARHRAAMSQRRSSAAVERLRERHRVRTLLSVYGVVHSVRVIPQGLLYSLIRASGALFTGHFGRARAAAGAWVWNVTKPGSLLARRRLLRRIRKVPDGEIRRLQVGGFAPVSAFLRGQFADDGRGSIAVRSRNMLRSLRSGPSRVSLGFWAVLAAVLAFGSRHLITRGVPVAGDMVPFDLGPAELFGRWFDSWSSTGTGHEAAAPTAYAIVGALGAGFLGFMGLLRTVLTVGMLPIGAVGMWRLLRPFASPWIRVVGTLVYATSAVPYNALVNGSWSALWLFGLLPWVLGGLGRAARVAPFGRLGGGVGEGVLEPSWPREILALGMLIGVLVAFVPFSAAIVATMVAVMLVGSLLAGWPAGTGRLLGVTVGALVVAGALNGPWLLDAAMDEPVWDWFSGTRPETPTTAELDELLRLDTGPRGGSVLGWALPLAAVTPLLLARGPRWAWAVRGLALYAAAVAVVWAAGMGWVPVPLPRPEVLLVPAALGLAVSAAMGVAAIERDLRTYRFGWRQLMPITAVAAVLLAALPAVASSFDGAWDVPDEEFNEQLGAQAASGDATRVLWIGHDDVLSAGGRAFEAGLTVAVTPEPVVGFPDRWGGTPEPADELLAEALGLAIEGGTSRLGRLLAPFAIGEIIVLEQSAPAPAVGVAEPVPDGLLAALTEQLDLAQLEFTPGVVRYRNTAVLPTAAVLDRGTLAGVSLRDYAGGRVPLSAGALEPTDEARTTFAGPVTSDQEVYAAVPASTSWRLTIDGQVATRSPALGWASAFQPNGSGAGELSHRTDGTHRLVIAVQAALWVVAALALLRLNTRAREHRR